MRRLCFAIWLVTLCFATAAAGKDLCLLDDDNDALYRFDKVKAPKSSMTAAPLTGVGLVDGTPVPLPLSGSVTRQGESLVFGFTRYGLFCLVAGTFEPAIGTGVFTYDCNLDGVADETVGADEVPCDGPAQP